MTSGEVRWSDSLAVDPRPLRPDFDWVEPSEASLIEDADATAARRRVLEEEAIPAGDLEAAARCGWGALTPQSEEIRRARLEAGCAGRGRSRTLALSLPMATRVDRSELGDYAPLVVRVLHIDVDSAAGAMQTIDYLVVWDPVLGRWKIEGSELVSAVD